MRISARILRSLEKRNDTASAISKPKKTYWKWTWNKNRSSEMEWPFYAMLSSSPFFRNRNRVLNFPRDEFGERLVIVFCAIRYGYFLLTPAGHLDWSESAWRVSCLFIYESKQPRMNHFPSWCPKLRFIPVVLSYTECEGNLFVR